MGQFGAAYIWGRSAVQIRALSKEWGTWDNFLGRVHSVYIVNLYEG